MIGGGVNFNNIPNTLKYDTNYHYDDDYDNNSEMNDGNDDNELDDYLNEDETDYGFKLRENKTFVLIHKYNRFRFYCASVLPLLHFTF